MKLIPNMSALVILVALTGNTHLFGDDAKSSKDTEAECDLSSPTHASPQACQVKEGFQWQIKYIVPKASSQLGQRWLEMLEKEVTLSVEVALVDLAEFIKEKTGLPVRLERRSPGFDVEGFENTKLRFEAASIPLRTVLAESLGSLGLKYRVDNDALTITSDMLELARREIGIHQWISLNGDRVDDIQEKLQTEISVDFQEEPLQEAIAKVSNMLNLPVLVDVRSLEDIGLSPDASVSLQVKEQPASSVLRMMLRDLDLNWNILDDVLTVTTTEACEQNLLNRIYWLEGLGGAEEEPAELIEIIESMIHPSTWEALGGPSSNREIPGQRPAIIVSTTFETHCQIASFIRALRDSNFGPIPVATSVKIPAREKRPSNRSGMGGGEMGGGGVF